jgi:hypothetical protein
LTLDLGVVFWGVIGGLGSANLDGWRAVTIAIALTLAWTV